MKTINIDGVDYVKKSDVESFVLPEGDKSNPFMVAGNTDVESFVLPEGDKSNPFMVVGKDYFIRTVTHYFTGRLVWVGDKEIAIEFAAWIADTGRFSEFVAGETGNEVEPFPPGVVIVGRGAIVDMSERVGGLLRTVK